MILCNTLQPEVLSRVLTLMLHVLYYHPPSVQVPLLGPGVELGQGMLVAELRYGLPVYPIVRTKGVSLCVRQAASSKRASPGN